jgi:hypothetical protein
MSASKACAGYIADRMIENARDCEDDVTRYSTDEEVIMEYLKELASAISKLLPSEIQSQLVD